MVQSVVIPLSWANNIPGVSGVDDVSFDIPQLSDIAAEVDRIVPGLEDIGDEVEQRVDQLQTEFDLTQDAIDEIVDRIVESIEEATGLDFPSPEEIAAELDDLLEIEDIGQIEVDVGGSLFDIEEDFVELLAAALNQVDLFDVDQFPTIGEIQEAINDALSDVSDLDVPTLDEILDGVAGVLTDLWPAVDGISFFDRPAAWVGALIEQGLDQAVDDQTQQELAAKAEEFR